MARLQCYVKYHVLTTQLLQHCICKTQLRFPYTIVPAPHERKQLHVSSSLAQSLGELQDRKALHETWFSRDLKGSAGLETKDNC